MIELYSHSYELTYRPAPTSRRAERGAVRGGSRRPFRAAALAYFSRRDPEEASFVKVKVVIADFDYGDNDIERSVLEPIGARVVAPQAKLKRNYLKPRATATGS